MGSILFAHFDIEADGPSPALNNMISIGVVFTNQKGDEVGNFLGDIEPLDGHAEDSATIKEFKKSGSLDRLRMTGSG